MKRIIRAALAGAFALLGALLGAQPAAAGAATGSPAWNQTTTFRMVNGTHGAWADSQVYWAIVGRDPATGQFVRADASGALLPLSLSDNGALWKNGQAYSDYFHTLAETRRVTIPKIDSARMYLSVGGPMYLQVNLDGGGHVAYAGPNIENPSDPNIAVTFDFVEMAIDGAGFHGNTTRVDQFGFPVKLRLQGDGGYDRTVGEKKSRAALLAAFTAGMPAEFRGLAQGPYAPYRIIAPAHASFRIDQPNGHYLDAYIAAMWARYTTQALRFTDAQGTFTGHVVDGAFVFTDGLGEYTIARAPTTPEVLLGNGVLNDPTGQQPGTAGWDKQLQIQAQVCAALNRHVFDDPDHWADAKAYYPAGQAANWYAQFWHAYSMGKLAYGFAYDDVAGWSSSLATAAPTIATVTIGW